jgi:transcriptional regulator with XRE-family HTH domain
VTKSIFTSEYRHLVRLLTEARTSTGVTQAELARRLHQPQSYVSKYEHCERRLDVAELLAISRALNLRASKLVLQIEEDMDK